MTENQKVYHIEAEPIKMFVGGTGSGASIPDFDKLTDVFGSEMVNYFFTEYFASLVAKSKLLDEISDSISNGADIERIKEILNG